jgi:hypothetical protein
MCCGLSFLFYALLQLLVFPLLKNIIRNIFFVAGCNNSIQFFYFTQRRKANKAQRNFILAALLLCVFA